MNKILFIAYYFPPMGGGGVQRSLRFAKYLPEFGVQPIVLTAASNDDTRWAPRDPRLLSMLPESVQVCRAKPLELNESSGRLGRRITMALDLPTPFGIAWRRAILSRGREVLAEHPDIRAVYVSLSPFEGASAAAELAREFGLPWVADLRDPWALDEMLVFPTALHRNLAVRKMMNELSSASVVVMNTPEAARRLREHRSNRCRGTITSITNGFDLQDYAGRARQSSPFFRIVHTGSFHSELGITIARNARVNTFLGRVHPGVDFRTRSPIYFVEALLRWFTQRPEVRADVRFIAAGQLESWDRDALRAGELGENLEIRGYCSHGDTVQLQVDADVLFLPMQNLPLGTRATIVPGKTYEYLASGAPILAAVPDGDARDFVAAVPGNHLCRPDDITAMTAALDSAYNAWKANVPKAREPMSGVGQFERRTLTGRLVDALSPLLTVAPASAST